MQTLTRFPLATRYLQELKPNSLPSSLTAGLLMGVMEIFFTLSFASLIFQGSLEASLSLGMGLALVSSATMLIVIGLASSKPGIYAVVQDVPGVLIAVIFSQMAGTFNLEAIFPTLLVMIALISIFTGSVMLLVGKLKLSGLIRYMPYPVVGGFLASTGWLLVSGAFPIMTGEQLSLSNLAKFAQPSQLLLWLPGLLIAMAVFLVTRFVRHPLGLPGILVGTLAIFYLALAFSGLSVNEATQLGLFPGNAINPVWVPPSLAQLQLVDWGIIVKQADSIAVIVGMSLVALFINIPAIETIITSELNLDQELRSVGLGNLLSGLAGGFIGYHVVLNVGIARRMGALDRATPLFAGAVCLLMVIFDLPLFQLIPKAFFAGILLALGFDFLFDWVVTGWKRFSRAEYACVLLILVVIVFTDFFTGVLVGLIAMVVLFTYGYSRVGVIRHSYSVGEVFSTVERSEGENQVLAKYGLGALVYELQGFLFFGTANVLLDNLKKGLALLVATAPTHVLVDFRAVVGIDSSAALSFQKILQLVKERDIQLVLTGVSPQICKRLGLDGMESETAGSELPQIRVMKDLDHGLECCEDGVLARYPQTQPDSIDQSLEPADALVRALVLAGLDEDMAWRAVPYVTEINLAPGDVLTHKGDAVADLFILSSGWVSVYLETGNEMVRLRSMGPGNLIGEMALYLHQPRTADVIVDSPSLVLCISQSALELISDKEPHLAAALHKLVVTHLARRISKDEKKLKVFRK